MTSVQVTEQNFERTVQTSIVVMPGKAFDEILEKVRALDMNDVRRRLEERERAAAPTRRQASEKGEQPKITGERRAAHENLPGDRDRESFRPDSALTGRGKMIKYNEAGWDRAIRVALGLFLLSLTVVGPQSLLGLVGFVPLVTGLMGFCPLYRLVGLSTCSAPKRAS